MTDPFNNCRAGLRGDSKRSRVSEARSLTVSVKTAEAPQPLSQRDKAVRLLCQALIRLYLQDDKKNPDDGKSMGIL